MWRKPFKTWYLVVIPYSRLCNLVLGILLASWEVSLAYVGSCRLSGLGGGSNLVTLAAGVLFLYSTLRSGCCLASSGVSTLGTFCAGLTVSGVVGSSGAAVGVTFLKMLARYLSVVIFSLPSCANKASGARFCRVSIRSSATAVTLSAETVAVIFTCWGGNCNVLPIHSASVAQIQVQYQR